MFEYNEVSYIYKNKYISKVLKLNTQPECITGYRSGSQAYTDRSVGANTT